MPSELDRNFGTAARVSADLIGDYGKVGEPDLSFHECPAVRVGAAFAYTRLNKPDGPREFSFLRVVVALVARRRGFGHARR